MNNLVGAVCAVANAVQQTAQDLADATEIGGIVAEIMTAARNHFMQRDAYSVVIRQSIERILAITERILVRHSPPRRRLRAARRPREQEDDDDDDERNVRRRHEA